MSITDTVRFEYYPCMPSLWGKPAVLQAFHASNMKHSQSR